MIRSNITAALLVCIGSVHQQRALWLRKPSAAPVQYCRCTAAFSAGAQSQTWLQVPGRARASADAGVRTRRQAAAFGSGLERPLVPLPVRMMHVLVQLLQEAQRSANAQGGNWRALLYGGEGEGSGEEDWETEDDGDIEEAEEGGADAESASAADAQAVVRSDVNISPFRVCSFDCSVRVAHQECVPTNATCAKPVQLKVTQRRAAPIASWLTCEPVSLAQNGNHILGPCPL